MDVFGGISVGVVCTVAIVTIVSAIAECSANRRVDQLVQQLAQQKALKREKAKRIWERIGKVSEIALCCTCVLGTAYLGLRKKNLHQKKS